MKQQDFWKWAQDKASKESSSGSDGRLELSELPADLSLSIPAVQSLHERIGKQLGTVDLILTDNRRRMVSVRKKRKRHRLRLHHMFVGCDDETIASLVVLARGDGDLTDSRRVIKDYISRNRDNISFDVDPKKLEAVGEHHDLQVLLDKWRAVFDVEDLAEVVITWGRYGRGQRTIRFGSYDFDRKLIRIHPALDQEWVSPIFVEFIVYHELLHALFPPIENTSRRTVHTPEFRRMEEKFPHYKEVMAWEQRHLSRFLER